MCPGAYEDGTGGLARAAGAKRPYIVESARECPCVRRHTRIAQHEIVVGIAAEANRVAIERKCGAAMQAAQDAKFEHGKG